MIVVKIQGGLGNQLFQYALYRKFDIMGVPSKVDILKYSTSNETRSYDLPKLGINVKELSLNSPERFRLIHTGNRVVSKIGSFLPDSGKYYRENNDHSFDRNILKCTDAYLEGYWMNPCYFSDIREKLIQDICFRQSRNSEYEKIRDQIMNCKCAVSIHVRQGDYLTGNSKSVYGGICTEEYYQKAVQRMLELNPNAVFFLFSDEMDKAKKTVGKIPCVPVQCNTGDNSYLDMYLMSICKHNIIANSTFSWWGAWLNQNNDKHVICPTRWDNRDFVNPVGLEGWISI